MLGYYTGMAKQITVANGQWALAPQASPNEWNGTCGKCNAKVPAIALEIKSLPFGRGERWQCKGGC